MRNLFGVYVGDLLGWNASLPMGLGVGSYCIIMVILHNNNNIGSFNF